MLIADNLAIAGRHLPLLEPTSLAVARGELLLVAAEPQPTRTALSLGLSARMRPTGGTVGWSGNTSLRSVRRISALVDSPEINEPEAHLKVRDLVAEDLALQPGPIWRRSGIDAWMKKHHMDELANEWLDAIDPLARLALLTHLALEDRGVEVLVFDSPDRHGIPEDDWFRYLESVATGRRAPAVVAVAQRIPANWGGSTAWAGRVQEKLAVAPAPAADPETEDQATAAPRENPGEPVAEASPVTAQSIADDTDAAAPTTHLTAPKEES
ncbi:ABC transporter ATP-binding protein [Paeniglutamicibacter sp. ABSL32-1]|uniref:ABC transporter ATP-binding protein n=1 Tax=Paeniglutamicibacter quisquiliarum TaxID=2849498 RepID=UPI001C2D601D|nr:ABC transporter ATP-binding protein [Paeniglutamicibacter quisquiliarum]MBV1780982.1 ABC transporter ATP-binding protein [Paeniglutamicibacter quisquiliarum]